MLDILHIKATLVLFHGTWCLHMNIRPCKQMFQPLNDHLTEQMDNGLTAQMDKVTNNIWRHEATINKLQHTSKTKKPPGFSAEDNPSHRWSKWSRPSWPPSSANFGSCQPTSGCRPGRSPVGMYGGLLITPVSFPLTSSRGSNHEPCLISTLSYFQCSKTQH